MRRAQQVGQKCNGHLASGAVLSHNICHAPHRPWA